MSPRRSPSASGKNRAQRRELERIVRSVTGRLVWLGGVVASARPIAQLLAKEIDLSTIGRSGHFIEKKWASQTV